MPKLVSTIAAVLTASARIRSLGDRPVVVKLGGSAMEEPAATRGMLESAATLQSLGAKFVLVHGGGKPIDRAMEAAGLKPTKIQGRRYTDEATLKIVVEVLLDLNRNLAAQLDSFGATVRPYYEAECFPIIGERLMLMGFDLQPIDLGRVGKIHQIQFEEFETDLLNRTIPVIPSLALDSDGGWLNVNADSVAAGLAGALESETVLFLTDTPGILKDRREPSSRIARLTESECRELISTGVVEGGMIPKAEACFEALQAGAKRAVILDGRDPHALLAAFLSDEPMGTEIVKN